MGITCALCHASVDNRTGRILEGAPNIDVNTGLVLAFATNSAAMFRQIDINPTEIAPGEHTYNVHGTNSDGTAGADASLPLLGIDKETYLGILFQNAANPALRLPDGAKPSEFFDKIDPTPGEPAINQVIRMPGYPKGSPFMLDGLMANSPGKPVGEQLNGMSAWQNTLAPPANRANPDLQRSNVDRSGHNYWVDAESGFTIQDQSDLIEFLLSLDDNPEVLTASSR